MSTTMIIAQIETCMQKAEQLKPKVDKLFPTHEQWNTLLDITARLSESAQFLQEKVRLRKEFHSAQIQHDLKSYRSHAVSSKDALCKTGKFKSAIFRRNITTIFRGIKPSVFDSATIRVRKESTRKRCKAIRSLNPDAIVRWSITYPPSLWSGGEMASDIFEALTGDFETDTPCEWPPAITDILGKLHAEESALQESPEFIKFREVISMPYSNREVQPRPKKRKRNTGVGLPSERRDNDNLPSRQIQYMFSKANVDKIPLLGPLLSNAIQASNQWKMERNMNEQITECFNTLLPEGRHEDISITLWVGRREGVQMIDFLNQQRIWSALPNHLSLQPQTQEELYVLPLL